MEPVAFWAHIGGFVAGMILMPLLSFGARRPAPIGGKNPTICSASTTRDSRISHDGKKSTEPCPAAHCENPIPPST